MNTRILVLFYLHVTCSTSWTLLKPAIAFLQSTNPLTANMDDSTTEGRNNPSAQGRMLCTCGKTFKDQHAIQQHRRMSASHRKMGVFVRGSDHDPAPFGQPDDGDTGFIPFTSTHSYPKTSAVNTASNSGTFGRDHNFSPDTYVSRNKKSSKTSGLEV